MVKITNQGNSYYRALKMTSPLMEVFMLRKFKSPKVCWIRISYIYVSS